jgi:hypothetical protein
VASAGLDFPGIVATCKYLDCGYLSRSGVRRLLVTASVVPSSQILVTLMKEALGFSETSVIQEPHGITSQKIPFFSVGLVKDTEHLPWYVTGFPKNAGYIGTVA